jgi:hypothetical protein
VGHSLSRLSYFINITILIIITLVPRVSRVITACTVRPIFAYKLRLLFFRKWCVCRSHGMACGMWHVACVCVNQRLFRWSFRLPPKPPKFPIFPLLVPIAPSTAFHISSRAFLCSLWLGCVARTPLLLSTSVSTCPAEMHCFQSICRPELSSQRCTCMSLSLVPAGQVPPLPSATLTHRSRGPRARGRYATTCTCMCMVVNSASVRLHVLGVACRHL